jgi:hypothetical protein
VSFLLSVSLAAKSTEHFRNLLDKAIITSQWTIRSMERRIMPDQPEQAPLEPLLRSVPARDISIHGVVFACSEEDVEPHRRRFTFMRRQAEEMMIAIPVVESENGQLYAFHNVLRIALYHKFAPDVLVLCSVSKENVNDPYDDR